MLELQLVYLHGRVGVPEALELAGVVEVQMTRDDGLDVLDVVAGGRWPRGARASRCSSRTFSSSPSVA